MPYKGRRAGIYISAATEARLQDVTVRLDVSQSELLAAIVMVMTNEEIQGVVARHRAAKNLERTVETTLTGRMLELIRGKTPEQLQQILEAARAAVPSDAES